MSSASIDHLPKRLQQQIQFILEIDKLKHVIRRTPLLDRSRRENDAEHSWHLAMMVMIFSEYAPQELNILRVLKMVLVHDIVEIDAGDMFIFGTAEEFAYKAQAELSAAKRIYGILPEDLAYELMGLWQEFEERVTPEAKFAAAIDRLQPMLHNYFTDGGTWVEFNLSIEKIKQSQEPIKDSSLELWDLIDGLTTLFHINTK